MKLLPKRTERDKQRIIEEAFDPNKIVLICRTHMYAGKGIPTENCRDCSQVFWMNWAAKLDPNKRSEIIEHMQELAHMAVELAEKGQWDVKLDKHPTVEVETGVGD